MPSDQQTANAGSRRTATLIGFVAILLWALLATFTAASGSVPPFLLTALSFSIASVCGVVLAIVRPGPMVGLRQPMKVWLLGVGGLFGYHFFYFTALRNAPPVEAGLIAYLWPLLIVLLSGLLPGEKLGWHHIAGGLLGLAGAALIVTGGGALSFRPEFAFGYLMALVCAFTWSGYSVLSRALRNVPSGIVTYYCLATAILAALCHLLLEETIWPQTTLEWLAVLGLGLGPVGLAFFVWDHGVKRGDIQVLGAASYAAPLLSTLVLIATGLGEPTWVIAIACLLITGGAALAAKDMIGQRSTTKPES